MKDLYYSQNEKILFWVAGYSQIDITLKVNDIIDSYKESVSKFLSLFPVEMRPVSADLNVKTAYIENGLRYKKMRVFYLENITPSQVPEEAFEITNKNDWTMWKWLNY